MRDPSFLAAAAQSLFALYLGVVLARGAATHARRALGRCLLELAVYGAMISTLYGSSDEATVKLLEPAVITLATVATCELVGFALWCARGADPSEETLRPRSLFVAVGVLIAGLFVRAMLYAKDGVGDSWPLSTILVVSLLLFAAAATAFAVAWRRRVPGGRRFFFATLWPVAPVVFTLTNTLGVSIPMSAFRLVRDLCVLLFQFSLLTAYLDDGHEPMSLKDRIVSSVLMAVLGLATVIAHLVLPLSPSPAAAGFLDAHAPALRLGAAMLVACIVVIRFAPSIFRRSVLDPLDRLTEALSAVEAERAPRELPVERKDELGKVARSFNTMTRALAEGREALAEKLHQLESRQREIEALNEELRRQIAARSRQLADALKDVDREVRPIQPGVTVDDRYVVEQPLGAGGMGVVFGARRINDSRELALKVILGGSPEDAVRFMREAEIAATLHHENLVSVIDVGMHHGTPYFVMERLAGGSLAGRADRFGDVAFMIPILLQVATGLDALHARGILHRDLKPANVLLAGDPARPIAKIADFGIARGGVDAALAATAEVADGKVAESLASTMAGPVMGTLPYMAPELADGPRAFGYSSDVFALGVLGCEVCTGALPFATPPIMTKLAGATPPAPAIEASRPELVRLLERCLAPSPAERPSAKEIYSSLVSIFGNTSNDSLARMG